MPLIFRDVKRKNDAEKRKKKYAEEKSRKVLFSSAFFIFIMHNYYFLLIIYILIFLSEKGVFFPENGKGSFSGDLIRFFRRQPCFSTVPTGFSTKKDFSDADFTRFFGRTTPNHGGFPQACGKRCGLFPHEKKVKTLFFSPRKEEKSDGNSRFSVRKMYVFCNFC